MPRSCFAVLAAVGLAACSAGAAKDVTPRDTGATSTPVVAAPALRSLASGTRIDATTQTEITSRTNKVGETLQALVSADVKDSRGAVVIPEGATVLLTIADLQAARDQARPDGRLRLVVNSVRVNSEEYPVTANLESVPHEFKGRGVGKDEVARVGAGTAIGAIAGQVIGKNTKSTVIGGAVGAAAGTAIAVRYAERDVVVPAGTPIVFTLTQSLNIQAR